MPLPASREETAAPGALAKSDTFNAIQDAIVGLHNLARGARVLLIGGAAGQGFGDWTFDPLGGTPLEPGWRHQTAAVAEQVIFPIPLNVGDRITAVRGFLKLGTATAGAVQMQLVRAVHASGADTVSTLVGAAASTARQALDATGITPTVAAAGEQWYVAFYANSSGIDKRVFGCEVTIDHPL